ncbi:hypothetical protein HMPREF9700_00349 [Bergeyella zoohelcum CCUG 30536]|uniref:Uncharacterized protein n=1 Tax=Bergeyella zoohelcum TaxID=1015 RepID=A0A376C003_9FLAO|nr:hypothetical protein HMPREF9700_00349 [Bergeyella zoohelcum CCUG 30536]SSZ47054.1 Uncharacterised protein [Bergeyella zoohelcum]
MQKYNDFLDSGFYFSFPISLSYSKSIISNPLLNNKPQGAVILCPKKPYFSLILSMTNFSKKHLL